jgi:cytochrome c
MRSSLRFARLMLSAAGFMGGGALAQAPATPPAADAALRGHGGPVRALAHMADGRLASAGFDGSIIVWDLAKGQAERVLRLHDTAVNVLATHAGTDCLLSGGEDGLIKYWCPNGAQRTLTGHEGAVSALAPGRRGEGMIVSGGWDRTVRLWEGDVASRIIAEHPGAVTAVLINGSSTAILSASQDGMVRSSPVPGRREQLARVLQLPVGVTSMAISGNGVLLACADGSLREADAELKDARIVAQLEGPLTAVSVSADGKTAATGGLRTPVTLIDLTDRAAKPVPLGNALPFWAMIHSSDRSEIFTGGNDRAVRRFDAATGSPVAPAIPKAAAAVIAEAKDRGAQVFRACAVCHGLTPADTHLAGPTLAGIMGRRIASLPGYAFSDPLTKMDIVWTPETVAKLFEVGPAVYTPGTKMPEQRLTSEDDRKALVDWLARVTAP